MLDSLADSIAELESFDIESEMRAIIFENKEIIIELLQFQMSEGKQGDGSPLNAKYGAFYDKKTISYKLEFGFGLGREIDRVTNYMFGDFYSNMYIVFDGDDFHVLSDVEYFDTLLLRSPKMMELGEDALTELLESHIYPQLETKINSIINAD